MASLTARQTTWRRFLRTRRGVLSLAVLALVFAGALLADFLAPYPPDEVNPRIRLIALLGISRTGSHHLLGTDQSGRDIASRILAGGRVSLGVAGAALTLALAVGVSVGLLSGYWGGWPDGVMMRLSDVQLAIPTMLLAIALAAALGPSLRNVIVVLAATGWVVFARTVRSTVLSLRELGYVEAARALGATDGRILGQHLLANTWTPIIVLATQQIALMIILESSLSFLGVGAPAGTPSWGTMIADGRDYVMTHAWWLTAFPGLAISLTVLALNAFGDGLRDALDPRLRL